MSPIRKLDKDVRASVLRIAPEKISKLTEVFGGRTPNISFVDESGFGVRVNLETNDIKLPIVALVYLWCASHAFWVVYEEYVKANRRGAEEFDLVGNQRLQKALELYNWGRGQLNNNVPDDWPSHLPMPDTSLCAGITVRVTTELYLCAVSWILLHEYGHIALGHQPSTQNMDRSRTEEKEADDYATGWIFDGVPVSKQQDKRSFGVSIATLVLTTQDLFSGKFDNTTHPKSFQRLYDGLTKVFDDDPDHLVYAFSTAILHMHLKLAGHEIEKSDDETWRTNLETCLTTLNGI